MPQLHLYVSDEVADKIKDRSQAAGLSVSRYLSEVVAREIGSGWPEGFIEQVAGGWQGELLERPAQGEIEQRETL